MNEQQFTQQLLEALQKKTQAILGNRTLDELEGFIPEAIAQYAATRKLIERVTAVK